MISPKKHYELEADHKELLKKYNAMEEYVKTFESGNWISNNYKQELVLKDKRILELLKEIEVLRKNEKV